MDYFAQLMTKDRVRTFTREADDARLRRLAGLGRPDGKPAPRHPAPRRSQR